MITNEQLIAEINKKTRERALLYITREKERAQGLENQLTNYQIISSSQLLDTAGIIEKKTFPLKSNIIVFKNNAKIKRLAKEKNLRLLNPDYALAEKFENKISQLQWLKKIIPKNLPLSIIILPTDISFKKLAEKLGGAFIAQFNRGHSGEGTFLISQKKQWEELVEKFPQREIKCSQFFKSPTFTLNACVWHGKKISGVISGNPSFQITGIKSLTDFPFSTLGNDWSLANKLLCSRDLLEIKKITEKIGLAMEKENWKGLFGLDLIKGDGKWLVVEINARQPASTGLETILQQQQGRGITILGAHFASLLKIAFQPEMEKSFQKINFGSQLIVRNKIGSNNAKFKKSLYNDDWKRVCERRFLGSDPIKIKWGRGKKINEEVFRVQNFKSGLVNKNGQLNNLAKKIINQIHQID